MTDQSMRDEFEACMSEPPFEFSMSRYPNDSRLMWPGGYRDYNVECAWAGWQAATRQALERAAKVCESVNNHDNPMTAQDCADAIRALEG